MFSDIPWGVVLIAGPIVLLAVIIFGFMRNRAAGRGNVRQAEEGAVHLREQIERDSDPR